MTSRTLQIIGRVSPALCSTPVRTPPAEGGAAGHPSKPAAKEGASNDRRGKGPETSKRKRGASRRQGRSKYDRSDPSHSTMRAPRIAGKEKGKRKKDPFKRRERQQIKLNWSISKASCAKPLLQARKESRAFEDFVTPPFGRCLLRRRRGAHPSDDDEQRGRLHRRREEVNFRPPEREVFPPPYLSLIHI